MARKLSLGFDCLEDRIALAGNVIAALSGQDLTLFGDHLGNEVRITQNSVGDVRVAGLNGTTINGMAAVTFRNPQLIKTEMFMGDGNDRVVLSGAPGVQVSNDVNIELGAGNDILRATSGMVGGNFTAKGDLGVDSFNLSGFHIGIDGQFDAGTGGGTIALASLAIGGSLGLYGDIAGDTFRLTDLQVAGDVNAETKEGNDIVAFTGVRARSLTVNTDLGADRVTLSDLSTSEDLKVETGSGNDHITLNRVTSAKSIDVHAGDNDDTVSGTAVAAAVDALFTGGGGVDSLRDNGITGGVKKEVKEFEILL